MRLLSGITWLLALTARATHAATAGNSTNTVIVEPHFGQGPSEDLPPHALPNIFPNHVFQLDAHLPDGSPSGIVITAVQGPDGQIADLQFEPAQTGTHPYATSLSPGAHKIAQSDAFAKALLIDFQDKYQAFLKRNHLTPALRTPEGAAGKHHAMHIGQEIEKVLTHVLRELRIDESRSPATRPVIGNILVEGMEFLGRVPPKGIAPEYVLQTLKAMDKDPARKNRIWNRGETSKSEAGCSTNKTGMTSCHRAAQRTPNR